MEDSRVNSSWDFLKTYGAGGLNDGVRHWILPSGIELVFLDLWVENKVESVFDIGAAPLSFCFHLSGHGTGTMFQSAVIREQMDVSPGTAIVSFNPGICCKANAMERQAFRVFNIYIAPERLYELLAGDISQAPLCIQLLFEKQEQIPFNLSSDISPACRMIIDQIYNCTYQGSFKNLYLESKTIELILRLLWEMAQRKERSLSFCLTEKERKQICQARDILIQQIDTPPTLKNLARKAGLNDTKLKRGFRQIFGTTVFGYLRQYRMEQATKLLSSGQVNVDETAYTLGFHDTAHFIHQFKQHYGTTPGTFLKQSRIQV